MLLALLGIVANPANAGVWDFTGGFCGGGVPITYNGVAGVRACEIVLTSDANWQAGTAWLDTPETLTSTTSFWSAFQLEYLGVEGTAGGDGMVFALQDIDDTRLGLDGGNLGYFLIPPVTGDSVAVEFDTWEGTTDPNDNDISILRDFVIDDTAP